MAPNSMRTTRRTVLTGSAAATAGLLAGCTGGLGGGGGDYPARDVEFIVPYGSGGLFHLSGLVVSQFLPEYLPGDGEMFVTNLEGQGGRRAANELYRAEPNGYRIGVFNLPGFAVSQILEDVGYDLREYAWVGGATTVNYSVLVNVDTPYQSLEDLQNADETVTFGVYGFGATGDIVTVLFANLVGIDAEYVGGFSDVSEIRAAVERGEVDAFLPTVDQGINYHAEGAARGITTLTTESVENFSPSIAELGYERLAELGRQEHYVGAPPETPDDIVTTLEDGMREMEGDEDLASWEEDNDYDYSFTPGDQVAENIELQMNEFAEFQDVLSDFLSE